MLTIHPMNSANNFSSFTRLHVEQEFLGVFFRRRGDERIVILLILA